MAKKNKTGAVHPSSPCQLIRVSAKKHSVGRGKSVPVHLTGQVGGENAGLRESD